MKEMKLVYRNFIVLHDSALPLKPKKYVRLAGRQSFKIMNGPRPRLSQMT